jgi:hypothetical protein
MASVTTPHEFRASLAAASPPEGVSVPLQALWWEAKGDWSRAHDLSQEAASREGDRVHAYLHRVEGDAANAGYWYRRAGESVFSGTLTEEWTMLVRRFLGE